MPAPKTPRPAKRMIPCAYCGVRYIPNNQHPSRFCSASCMRKAQSCASQIRRNSTAFNEHGKGSDDPARQPNECPTCARRGVIVEHFTQRTPDLAVSTSMVKLRCMGWHVWLERADQVRS